MQAGNKTFLFNFIEFFYSNIDNFNQYENDLKTWRDKKSELSGKGLHFTHVIKKRKLGGILDEKWNIISEHIINPIKKEGLKNLFFDYDNEVYNFNSYHKIVLELSRNFSEVELPAILKAKKQYIDFRCNISPYFVLFFKWIIQKLDDVMTFILKVFWEEGDKRFLSTDEIVSKHSIGKKKEPQAVLKEKTILSANFQSVPNSPSSDTTVSSLNNNVKPINNNTMDIDFERIFAIALSHADDPTEMRQFCIREQKKANRDFFYKKENFYNGLLKIVADKKELAKYQSKPGPTPTHIGSFFIAGGGGSGYDYESIELLEQIIEELRNKGNAQGIEQTNKDKHENNATLSPEIKPLFNFIDFLHANIENFNQYDNVLLELNEMFERFFQLGFHIEEIIERKALQKEIDVKWAVISDNIITPIKDKVAELKLFDWYAPKTFDSNYFEIANELTKTCEKKDFDAIYYAKRQYIEFTNEISSNVISNVTKEAQSMFEFLNKMMSEIAKNFSKEGDKPIKKIEAKQVDDIQKEIESYKSGEIASLPLNITNSNTVSTQSNLSVPNSKIENNVQLIEQTNKDKLESKTTPALSNASEPMSKDSQLFVSNLEKEEDLNQNKIDANRLSEYFIPQFKGMGRCENDFEKLVQEVEAITEDYQNKRIGKKIAQIALLIYNSEKLNARKPYHFVSWHKVFCECIAIPYTKYYPSDLKPIPKNLIDLFIYLN